LSSLQSFSGKGKIVLDVWQDGNRVTIFNVGDAYDGDGNLVLSLNQARELGHALTEGTPPIREDQEFDDE
jgi:hypothetical protein